MRVFNKVLAAAAMAAAGVGLAQADGHGPDKLFVSVTSDDLQTQGMSMILATQGMQQGQEPRILLCGPGAEMATDDYSADALEPAGANPQQMMRNLIDEGVQVEVCAIFLPNTDYTEDDLIEGVGVAEAPEVAEYMADPSVRHFSN
ncbi:DsrE family protein [Halorhodospira sp. 9621]|uniref:DsrE family protein n=1 Tax=Halorhodospira sp. 9621 TaxID=2899135 RepID=UPI001EE7BF9A|nr:DsrE family protein [Halorhodospira sp. 9621]MCG5532160.1 DsrE family protein [Halorhodospira sp. 9621]